MMVFIISYLLKKLDTVISSQFHSTPAASKEMYYVLRIWTQVINIALHCPQVASAEFRQLQGFQYILELK